MRLDLTAASLTFLAIACSPAAPEVSNDSAASLQTQPVPENPYPNAPADAAGAPASRPVSQSASRPTSQPVSPDATAVTVNGKAILEGEIEERIVQMASQQMGGMQLPPEHMGQMREMLRQPALQALVDNELMTQAVEAAGVTSDIEERVAELERNLQGYLFSSRMSRDDLEQQIMASENMPLDDYVKREADTEQFKRTYIQIKLLETNYPERMTVSAEDVAARYEADRETIFTRPDMVRASHILIVTNDKTPEAAQAKAEEILALAQAEGADFAELAKEHSEGPSAPLGGDLGFFRREGQMVESIAAAAFALELGDVSGPVETQHGLHIVKLTEKQPAGVSELEEAEPVIRGQIRVERVTELRAEHLVMLRETAEIVPASAP